jgi:hypothetical protein
MPDPQHLLCPLVYQPASSCTSASVVCGIGAVWRTVDLTQECLPHRVCEAWAGMTCNTDITVVVKAMRTNVTTRVVTRDRIISKSPLPCIHAWCWRGPREFFWRNGGPALISRGVYQLMRAGYRHDLLDEHLAVFGYCQADVGAWIRPASSHLHARSACASILCGRQLSNNATDSNGVPP